MKFRSLFLAAAAGFATAVAAAQAEVGGSVDQAIREHLAVSDWTIQSLTLPPRAEGALDVPITLDGRAYVISLLPHSLRSAGFQVVVETAPGVYETQAAPPPATFRGAIAEMPGSEVAASFIDGQLFAIIDVGDGALWGVQPLSEVAESAARDAHVVYHSDDLLAVEGACGLDDIADLIHGGLDGGGEGGPDNLMLSKETEIALDADVEYFRLNGSSVPATVADIENIINRVTLIYERDVQVCFVITQVVVRQAEPDPYTSTDPVTLLTQFHNQWNANHGGILRDTAHMFTGKNIDGNVIGIAWGLRLICVTSSSYALSQARWTSNLTFRTGLVAHEIGHLYGAAHCDAQPDCRIMCSGLGGCSGNVSSFGPSETPSIINHRNSRVCLTNCGPDVTCDDIKKITAKCTRGGVIKGKVKLFAGGFDGSVITLDVAGERVEAVISGFVAPYEAFFFDPGRYDVVVIDPPGCGLSKNVRCE